jgi:hypothetical protein
MQKYHQLGESERSRDRRPNSERSQLVLLPMPKRLSTLVSCGRRLVYRFIHLDRSSSLRSVAWNKDSSHASSAFIQHLPKRGIR